MGEVPPKAPSPLHRQRLGMAQQAGRSPTGGLLRRAEIFLYWLAVAPLIARLPSRLAYRAACWRGDLTSWLWPEQRFTIEGNLHQVLGDEISSEEAKRVARELLRSGSCEVIDVMRLRGRARSLGKLVEIRGREHLDAALAEGKGAILCTGHFGSFMSAFSLLHAGGVPVTTIGRWWWNYTPGVSPATRRFWASVYANRVLRHRQGPNIEPWTGRVQVALQAAAVLRRNEAVMICCDAAPLDSDRTRTLELPFLGRKAKFLPGVVTLARLTGAPVLPVFIYRSPDYRHQVLEISPPVPMDGETTTAFEGCVAAIETAVRRNPLHWLWTETHDLISLGLLPAGQHDDKTEHPLERSLKI